MQSASEEKCELCKLEKKTYWHYSDKDFVIIDCINCNCPMIVFRKHRNPTLEEQFKMLKKAKAMFPDRKPDFTRRKIKDHFHFHLIQ